jgi:hypothetical protein
MIPFFRKIRYRLAKDNQFFKYSRYAIGEVILIMLGIFMALQLQNWNENRKKENAFKLTLEHLYNTMNEDVQTFQGLIGGLENQVETIDYMLESPDSIQPYYLPYVIQSIFMVNNKIQTRSSFYAENLVFNPENRDQINISKQIVTYINGVQSFESQIDNRVAEIVQAENIQMPKVDPDNPNAGFTLHDSLYYSQDQIKKARDIIYSEKYRAALQSVRTRTIFEGATINVLLSDAKSVIRQIKKYYPEVKLIYEDVGIIGTSIDGFDDVGAISTPMRERKQEAGVWEIDLYLKEGRVKFRCRDSWSQNWGGNAFPEGDAHSFGADIVVSEPGQYNIVLDLNEGRYFFNRIE